MTPATLDALLARWADRHQLTEAHIETIRAAALGESSPPTSEPDADWLWDLLRPVTALLDGPHRLHDTLTRPYTRFA
jgi:hypothetical protein